MTFRSITNYNYNDKCNFEKVSDKPSQTDSSFYKSVEAIFNEYVVEGKIPAPDYTREPDFADSDEFDDDDFSSVLPNSKDLADVSEAYEYLDGLETSTKPSKDQGQLETLGDVGVRPEHADADKTSVSLDKEKA